MAVTRDKSGPYAPSSTIIEVIGRFRSRGLPVPVNGETLARVGVPESLIPRTLQALQTLDLVDAKTGQPTDIFEAIRLAPEAEYKKRLEDWLKGAYADVFSFVDPTKDDETHIRDAFRGYQPVGQQDRMVSLFQGLCVAAGLISEKSAKDRAPASPRPRPTLLSGLRRVVADKSASNPPAITPAGLPVPLAGLLTSLPSDGAGWTKETRDKFMVTFGTVLDFCIPIVKHNTPTAIKENGGQS